MVDSGHFFISYARDDLAYAAALVKHLETEGVRSWIDKQIPSGERWDGILRGQIETSAAVILIMTAAAGRSEWVAKEVRHARLLGKTILPLLVSGEILFGLNHVQVETVVGGDMPSEAFVERLRKIMARRWALRYASGVIPEAADSFQFREVADQIDAATRSDDSAFLTGGSARILSGLGGVGKTQLAAAVARRARANAEVELLLWVVAISRVSIVTAYGRAAVDLVDANPDDPESAAQAFLEYLAYTDEQWLIVFDDLTDPNDLNSLWPPRTPTGRVIVTTQRADASLRSHGSLIPVDLFSPAEARRYLAEKFANDQTRLAGADELAGDLGYLPLALAQAAAYITDGQMTCSEYRSRLDGRRRRMADLVPESLPDDYTQPLTVTVSLSVDAANALRPVGLARPLLVLLSLLDSHGVPTSLLTSVRLTHYLTRNQSPRPDTARLVTADDAHETLAVLVRLSLAASTDGMASLHRLVQRCVLDEASADLIARATSSAAGALVESWPQVDVDPLLASALRDNAAALRANAGDQLWKPEPHPLLLRLGKSLVESGLATAAIEYEAELVAQSEIKLGSDDATTLSRRFDLAVAHEMAGHTGQAVSLYRAVAADRERVLGPNHPDTLKSRNNLARAYLSDVQHEGSTASRLDEAVALAEASLADRERVLGARHRDTLISRIELGRAYQTAGRIDEAIALFEPALRSLELAHGPNHPETLVARVDLANAYTAAGRFDDAITLYEQVLAQEERVVGPYSPERLATCYNLANAYGSSGRVGDAIVLCEAILPPYQQAIPDHPRVFAVREVLANSYVVARRFDDGIALHRINLADLERVLGPDDADTLSSRLWLAWAYRRADRMDEAISQFDAALAQARRTRGPNDPITKDIRSRLIETKKLAGRSPPPSGP